MDALSPSLLHLPALPPSPSSSSSSATSSRKRTAASVDVEPDDSSPLTKKRVQRSTAAEKAQKKAARMERNRIAAQVSRDKKKQHTEVLEARVAELEAQLAAASSSPSSSSSSSSALALSFPSPAFSLPPAPTTSDPVADQLREENEALRTQLELEKLQSQALQIRLSALESKFGRLEQLLSRSTMAAPVNEVKPEELHGRVEPVQQEQETMMTNNPTTEKDSSRLVAREVDQSLQRKLSHPLSACTSRRLPLLPSTPSSRPSALSPASTLASTSAPPPPPRTLHQILSSIRIPLAAPTTSLRPGLSGPTRSTRPLSSRRSLPSSRSNRRSRSSTSSSFCAKTPLRVQRLRLFVRR
ncbi:hypothetical protein JCM8097_005161 [Rhodosporidiobolus ruineniae]